MPVQVPELAHPEDGPDPVTDTCAEPARRAAILSPSEPTRRAVTETPDPVVACTVGAALPRVSPRGSRTRSDCPTRRRSDPRVPDGPWSVAEARPEVADGGDDVEPDVLDNPEAAAGPADVGGEVVEFAAPVGDDAAP